MGDIEPNITKQIRTLLSENSIEFIEIDHEPAITCEQSAKARRCSQEIGAIGPAVATKAKADDPVDSVNCFSELVLRLSKETRMRGGVGGG